MSSLLTETPETKSVAASKAPAKRGAPPSLRQHYPLQFVLELARDRIGLFQSMAKLGDITQIKIATQRVVLVQDPDAIKSVLVTNQKNFVKGRALDRVKVLLGQGLLTNEGEAHLRQRRLMQPAFHKDRIASYASVMSEHGERIQQRWSDGETLDIHEEMMHVTLGIATKTLFNADVENEAKDVAEALDLSLKMFDLAILPGGAFLEYLPVIPWVRKVQASRRRMDELIYRIVSERRKDGRDHGDLLSMLIAATDTEGDGKGMSDQQLRDELVTIMMAGHETTAVALSWTWYLLSQNPDVEAKLHEELDRVLGGRTPTYDDLPNLTYTRMVLAESMRLYPPAWTLERMAVNDCEIGGYTIKANTLVLMSQYIAHRDPRWWPEPEKFDPMRWTPEAQTGRPKFAYFPFGAGTRICIGEQFAWMEGTLLLAAIAQRWKMRHDPTHVVEKDPLVTLRPKYGMRMTLTRR
jgi:cytochrome P450